jgi:gamma-D-glutamyl-L-lysine dipeptidyl-peptidase
MSFGICPISVVSIRNSPSHRSEMISQLLFGELVEILEAKGRQWLRIRCHWDNLVGWAASSQIASITPSEFENFQHKFAYNLEVMQAVLASDHYTPITLGAHLPNFDGLRFSIGPVDYTFSGQAVFPHDIKPSDELVLKIAKKYLNAPYLWGGRSPFGIDSDGLVQMVFKIAGFKLPREAAQQVHLGETVDFIEQAFAGDLAFFENRHGRITHTGIILPDKKILHAFGKVRIDIVDHFGIYNEELSRYTHRLRVIKRLLSKHTQFTEREEKSQASLSRQFELF